MIEIYTSPTCPHCPHAKNAVSKFIQNRTDVDVKDYNTYTKEGQKKAQLNQIRSVPTLIITGPGTNERIGYVGAPGQAQLQKMVDIALGVDKFEEKESKTGFFNKIINKIKGD